MGVAVPLSYRCMSFVLGLADDGSGLPATALSFVSASYVARVHIDMSLVVLAYIHVGAIAATDAVAAPHVYFFFC